MIRIHFETGPRRVAEAKAGRKRRQARGNRGTGEGISAHIHVANSHADRAEDGRKSDRRYSANSLWERVDSSGQHCRRMCRRSRRGCVSHYKSDGFNRGWKLTRIKKRKARAYNKRGCNPTHRTHWSLHQLGFLLRVNEADLCSTERPNWSRN